MNDSNGSQVAVFIDYENVFIEFGKKITPPEQINWEEVLETAKRYGGSLICKAYADWSGNWTVQDKLVKMGIQPINVPSKRRGKNGVDVKMAVDALDLLILKNNNIGSLVLVSGDGDFTALVNYLKDYGKFVVGIGVEGSTAEYLVNACNEFKYLVKNSELVDANQRNVKDPKPPRPAVGEAGRTPEQTEDRPLEARDAGHNGLDPHAREYLGILHKNRILIEPSQDRHFIIKKSFYILEAHGGKRFAEIKDKITSYFEKNKSGIDKGHVNESIQQILKSDCLDFDSSPDDAASSPALWDRKVYLKNGIDTPAALLRTVDRFLSEIIRRETAPKEINCAALSTVLYGTAQKPELVNRVRHLVDHADQRPPG